MSTALHAIPVPQQGARKGSGWIYLDAAASTVMDTSVVARVQQVSADLNANPSSVHSGGVGASMVIEEARQAIARRLGCEPDELVFTFEGDEHVCDGAVLHCFLLCGAEQDGRAFGGSVFEGFDFQDGGGGDSDVDALFRSTGDFDWDRGLPDGDAAEAEGRGVHPDVILAGFEGGEDEFAVASTNSSAAAYGEKDV